MYDLLATALRVLSFILIARAVLSWVAPQSSLYQRLSELTEPLLSPIRRLLPSPRLGQLRLDLAPLVLLFLVSYAARFLA
jgi:YggT family protein